MRTACPTSSRCQHRVFVAPRTKRSDDIPSLMFYVDVDDIAGALAAVEAAGGKRLTGRMPIPAVGRSAFFEDTEGNKIGLFQTDPTAPMPEGAGPA